MRHLTAAELGIWFGHQTASDPSIYHCAELMEFDTPLNVELFKVALRHVLSHAEVLSECFVEHQGIPRAVPLDVAVTVDQRWRDMQRTVHYEPSESDNSVGLRNLASQHSSARLDPESGKTSYHVLFACNDKLYGWLHVAHHIALDGFGFRLIANAIAAEYNLRQRSGHADNNYFERLSACIEEDTAYRQSPQHQLDASYFAATPCSVYPRARLLTYENIEAETLDVRTPVQPRRYQRLTSPRLLSLLKLEARELGASWPEVALAITAHFIAQSSKLAHFALGIPVMLRLGSRKAKVPCMAMNIVRLPLVVDLTQPVSQTVVQLQKRWRAQSSHHRFRYEELDEQRFGPVINILPFTDEPTFGQVRARSTNLRAGPVVDLAIMIAPRDGRIEITLDGHPELFGNEGLSRLGVDLINYLELACARRLSNTPERKSPLQNDVYTFCRWTEFAVKDPDKLALVDGPVQCTYSALLHDVMRQAAALQVILTAGVYGPTHRIVALEIPRSIHAVTLLLAVLQVGACYSFLDPEQPLSRRKDLLERLRPDVLITTAPEAWGSGMSTFPILSIEQLLELPTPDRSNEYMAAAPTDPAYVVFTSGSTGTPKAVTIPRRALSEFVSNALQVYGIGSQDRVLQFAPFTFDASVEEVFCSLCCGATLVLRNASMLDSMQAFVTACNTLRISVLDLPTAFWHEWVQAVERSKLTLPPGLRLVLIGGEAADPNRVRAFREWAPAVRLLNTYGPSEVTVVATCSDLTSAVLSKDVPIGRPLASVGAHVVGEHGQLLQGACEGELYLTGPQLALGYLRQSRETESKFVSLETAGRRAYRTGDRVRRDDSGELYFVGRIDNEFKLSGYRINPAEVEALLNGHPNVAQSVVTALADQGQPLLTAHLQLALEPGTFEESEWATIVRQYLLDRLPPPMVPTRFMFHREFPTSSSGKLDRAALKVLQSPNIGSASPEHPPFHEEPGTSLLAIWRQVLGRPNASADDDFFKLGGHSLQVIQMATRLNVVDAAITVSAIFRHSTPRRLLAFITHTSSDQRGAPFDEVEPYLPVARQVAASAAAPTDSVLLTGATGFVGTNVLAALIARGKHVSCVVRAASSRQALERLFDALRKHGCTITSEQTKRLRVIPLDLDEVASADSGFDRLGSHATVIHCAATVNLTRSFSSLASTNVTATHWLLRYAQAAGASFCYISTLAVAPSGASGGQIPEEIFEAHTGLADGYQQSKWHAERLCKQAAEHGVRVRVVRLGRITGSLANPLVNGNDLVWRIARAATRAEHWPELPFEEVWTPVDTASSIILELVLRDATNAVRETPSVVHIAHQGSVHLDRLFSRLVAAGYRLARCPIEQWLRRVRAVADAEDLATLAFFDLAAGRQHIPQSASFASTNLLSELPELDQTPIADELIDRYIRAAQSQGLLPRN